MKPGTMAAVPSAEMKPHSEPVEVTKVVILTGTVRMMVVRNKDRQELGPGEDEAEHRRRRDAAAHHRQDDAAEGLPARGAVDHRGLVDILRHVVEEGLHQQDGDRQVHQRVDQDQSDIAHEQVIGVAQAGDLYMKTSGTMMAIGGMKRWPRTQLRKPLRPLKVMRDERIGGEHRDDHGERGRADRDDDRIEDGLARIVGAGAADAEGRAAFDGDLASATSPGA